MDITTQIFLYGLALAVVTLAITIFYLLNLYRDVVKKLSDVKTGEKIKINEYVEKKAQNVIDALSEDVKKKMASQLSEVIENTKTNLDKKTEELVIELKNQFSSQTFGSDKSIKEGLMGIEEAARKVIEEEYGQVKNELATYKKQKMAEIDAKVKEILPQVLKEVVTKSLSPSQQEELVLNALENAKRQNLL